MSLEGIIERIISDAKQEAESVMQDARHREEDLLAEAARAADEYYRRQLELLEEKYRREKERSILNRRLEQRKRILQSRQGWMDRAFQEAYEALIHQPDDEYRELMIDLVLKASISQDETLQFGGKGSDKDLRAIVDEANNQSGGRFTLAKERGGFPWGFVLKKEKVETNMSIDSLFKYRRNDLEQGAWELFNAR
jgi:V/A-type H+-transporting ATPase subunit E